MTSDAVHSEREAVDSVHHRISMSHFTELADGGGGAQAITALRHAEAGRRILLLRSLLEELRAVPGPGGPLTDTSEAWSLLVEARRSDVHTVLSLLAAPHVGLWATRLLRRLRQGATAEVPLWVDAGHFHALAASAAVLTGVDFRTRVPMRDGQAVLPTLGCAVFPGYEGRAGRDRWEAAEVTGSAEGAELTVPGIPGAVRVRVPDDPLTDAPGWRGARVLHAAKGRTTFTLRLEDLDPHRGLRHWMPPGPVTPEEEDRWRLLLDRAWPLIADMHTDTAEAMARARLTLTPRPPAARFRTYSVSPSDGFGAVRISLPADPAELAVTLVREFQHTKLTSLMSFTPLYDEVGRGLHYAPWRDDPKPLGELLQGAYAFFGVTRFWRSRRRSARGAERALAEFEFALWRHQTWLTVNRLRRSPHLTAAGRRVAASLESRLSAWLPEPVSDVPLSLAEAATADHGVRWRMHHLRPNPGAVTAAARAWLDDRPAPAPPPGDGQVRPDPGARDLDSLALLFRQRLTGAAGDTARTARTGEPSLADGSESPRAWAEFALALAAASPGPASRLLLKRPEWVRAVHLSIHSLSGRRAAPEALTRWLATGIPARS